jgi:16S rRNA (guanine527-N7)-methyltransferase
MSSAKPSTRLEGGLKALGLAVSLAPLLEKYVAEIELFNDAYGLVKVADRDELVVKHILDSLAPLKVDCRNDVCGDGALEKADGSIRDSVTKFVNMPECQIADVGSGAGLPGIPLAIALPGASFTLIERMARRVGFLHNTVAALGLKNVKVEEAELEKAEGGRFDVCVFRAFRPLEKPILKGLLRLLKPQGILAAWKGKKEAVEAEMGAAEKAAPEIEWEAFPVEVPFLNEERHLLIIRNR